MGYRPDVPADEGVITNAEWLRLTGELLDSELTLIEQAAPDLSLLPYGLPALLGELCEQHSEEVCDHCYSHLPGPKSLSPSNPACDGRWCTEATLSWLQAPCADTDTD